MSLLRTLLEQGALRALDHAFAQALRRLDPATPDDVLAAAALASLAVSAGHAAVDLRAPGLLVAGDIAWPGPEAWLRSVAASRLVAQPAASDEEAPGDAPLVLEHGLLYLRRYREYERRLAAGLHRIGGAAARDGDPAALAPLFAQLFPDAGEGDRQARAAEMALRHPLLLVTGGPGTGKTTTITRLLVLLAARAAQAGLSTPAVALAAPTGRAAERMADSVRRALQALAAGGIEPGLLASLPTAGTTLHRLLGTVPDSPRVRHHADNPLPHDIVVVDEASMIDLPLMAKLVEAVGEGAQLILIGDPDQLPSVEAGDVLSGILRATGPWARVHLERNYRQSAQLQLSALADAVRAGDDPAQRQQAVDLLRGGRLGNVHFHEDLGDPLEHHRDELLVHWRAIAAAASPAEALAGADRLRILTAVREGPQGARTLNARIEALLTQTRRRDAGYFHGRLLLVTENNAQARLFNGDIGVCFRDERGVVMAWFPGDDPGHPRPFHPATLPAHESAFAMTVHKAQGSEFDEVWLLLPAHESRVLTRELVYTGITRARQALHVAGSTAVLEAALARHAHRWSGLGHRFASNGAFPTSSRVRCC